MFKSFGLFLSASLLLCVIFFTNACKKESTESPATQEKVSAATKALQSFQLFHSAFNMANRGTDKLEGLANPSVDDRTDTCGVVSVTPADLWTYPKTVVVDFGTGCTDGDGIFKTGKVTMLVGKVWEPNSSISVTYDNYTENGVKLGGTFIFQNNSTAAGGVFQIQANNVTVTDLNQQTSTYNAVQTYTQIAGAPSWWDWSDDVYAVTGTIDALLGNGDTANWTINTSLIKANNCPWVSQGTGTLTLNGSPILVDYGNGTCDNQAVVTINGQSYPITL